MENIKTADIKQHQQALYRILAEFDRVCRILNVKYILFAGTMLGAVRHRGFIPWDDDLDIIMPGRDYEKFLAEADKHIDKEKFFLQKEFSRHWPMFFSKLRMNNTTCLEKFHPKDKQMHQGIYMDIFPCDNLSENPVIAKLQFLFSKIVIAKSLYRRGYETDSTKKKIFMAMCRLLPLAPFVKFVKGKKINSTKVHTFLAASSKYEKSVFDRKYFENIISMDFEQGQYPVSRYYDDVLTILYGDYMQLPPEADRVGHHYYTAYLKDDIES